MSPPTRLETPKKPKSEWTPLQLDLYDTQFTTEIESVLFTSKQRRHVCLLLDRTGHARRQNEPPINGADHVSLAFCAVYIEKDGGFESYILSFDPLFLPRFLTFH
jgi:hypothetical protein